MAVGDSLLHGRGVLGEQTDLFAAGSNSTPTPRRMSNEFVRSCDMLDVGSYHVVVGNPPYITVKDEKENRAYRKRYRPAPVYMPSLSPSRRGCFGWPFEPDRQTDERVSLVRSRPTPS